MYRKLRVVPCSLMVAVALLFGGILAGCGGPADPRMPVLEFRISLEEAFEASIISNATAPFEGDIRGSIKVAKLADITFIDRNLLEIDPTEILDMEIEMTIFLERVVYES